MKRADRSWLAIRFVHSVTAGRCQRGDIIWSCRELLRLNLKIMNRVSSLCINLSPCLQQRPLRRKAKTLRPHQTLRPAQLPHCSIAGVTTWAPRVEGSPSRSSVTMVTMATWAIASLSPGQSQIYDRMGQSVNGCVHLSVMDWSHLELKSWLCYSKGGPLIISVYPLPLQVQKHFVFIRPSSAQRHLHLCQRSLISVAALRPHGHPEDSTTPAQRDHTGGWPQQQP